MFQQNPLTTAAIKFRGAAAGMADDSGCYFQKSSVLQVVPNASSIEGARAIADDTGFFEKSFQEVDSIKRRHKTGSRFTTFA